MEWGSELCPFACKTVTIMLNNSSAVVVWQVFHYERQMYKTQESKMLKSKIFVTSF